jgi:hypothetical protein
MFQSMIIFILVLIALVVAAGLIFALGAGLVALVPVALAVAVGVWLVWAFFGARSPGTAARRAEPAELLGPGGPDDPENTANRGGPPVLSGEGRGA